MKYGALLVLTFQSLSRGTVKIISGTSALRMTSNQRISDWPQTARCVTVCFLRLLIECFLTFLFIIERNTLKIDCKIKICFPGAAYRPTLKFFANHYS